MLSSLKIARGAALIQLNSLTRARKSLSPTVKVPFKDMSNENARVCAPVNHRTTVGNKRLIAQYLGSVAHTV